VHCYIIISSIDVISCAESFEENKNYNVQITEAELKFIGLLRQQNKRQ